MSMIRVLLIGLFLLTAVAGAQESAKPNVSGGVMTAEQSCYDVLRYDLSLRVDPEQKRIDGVLVMKARIVAETSVVALDLDSRLAVTSLTVGDVESESWRHEDGRIVVDLGSASKPGAELTIAVAYGGTPRIAPRPPWEGGFTWSRTRSGDHWIATSCQGEGGDLWWPCKDHPSEKPEGMDLHIEVPKGLVCASNGTLVGEKTKGKWTTFHWRIASPIACYNVALNIAPYEVLETRVKSVAGGTIPVKFWVLPESVKRAKKALPEFVGHLQHMERVCGPYPFRHEKYGIVETPHLGMEHQTIIAYGYRFRGLQEAYDWLHHHEMSHEWWGNLVTCRDWKDMWIHEGIGTYMQPLYLEERYGVEAYDGEMERTRRQIANRRPIAPRESQDSKQIYFGAGIPDNDIYYKGSWVMHTLRWVLGDETFSKVVRRMAYADPEKEGVTDGSQVRSVDTEEMIAIAEKVSGVELGWFFEVYLRRGALPVLEQEVEDGVLRLRWRAPDELPFPMPVPVRVGKKVVRVAMQDGTGSLEVGKAKHDVDPRNRVLKEGQLRRIK